MTALADVNGAPEEERMTISKFLIVSTLAPCPTPDTYRYLDIIRCITSHLLCGCGEYEGSTGSNIAMSEMRDNMGI